MLNRKLAPPTYEVKTLNLPQPNILQLDNGIPVYVLDFPGQEIVKIELVFRAGRPEEHKRLAARATAQLLREGSAGRNSAEIAEHFDFYGGSIGIPVNLDTSNFILFSLRKYAAQLIPTFAEIITKPEFPEKELETFRSTSIQELTVELEKAEVLAYRHVTELIFGKDHPYGYNSVATDYQNLDRTDLIRHYERWYRPDNVLIIASGRIDDEVFGLLNQHLGQFTRPGTVTHEAHVYEPIAGKPKRINIAQPESMQTAIKIGRKGFQRNHPDFGGLFVLNTILGGYFGSRLMMNIREKKGFTYNIYSTLDSMHLDGCLYIATEVNKVNAASTLRAIYAEMKKLRDKPVSEEELSMVRNYLLGMLLNGLDGPINISEVVRGMIVDDLPWDSYDRLAETIRTITAEQVQELAQRYLQKEDFWTVVAG